MMGRDSDNDGLLGVHEGEYVPASKSKKMAERPDVEEEEMEEEEEEVYDVEYIADMRLKRNGKREFFIKWLNFPHEDNTWEPEDNVSQMAIENFYNSAKGRDTLARLGLKGGDSGAAKKRKTAPAARETPEPASRKSSNINRASVAGPQSMNADQRAIVDFIAETDLPEQLHTMADWTDMIKKIENVTRSKASGDVFDVFVVWKDGTRSVHPSPMIHDKAPKKLIEFYEGHIKFSTRD